MLNRLRISDFYVAPCNTLCHPLNRAGFPPPQNVAKRKVITTVCRRQTHLSNRQHGKSCHPSASPVKKGRI